MTVKGEDEAGRGERGIGGAERLSVATGVVVTGAADEVAGVDNLLLR